VGAARIASNIGYRGGVLGPAVKAEAREDFLDALAAMTVITELAPGDLVSPGGFAPPAPIQTETRLTVSCLGLPRELEWE
jgi:2-keto-4-pentenoate hydratase